MMTGSKRQERFDAFDRMTELPMLVLALAIIPLLLAPMLWTLSPQTENFIIAANGVIWLAFAVELCIKTYLAPNRLRYLRAHWYDVLIVLLPFLRPLRIVRSARALRLLRGTRLVAFAARSGGTLKVLLDRHGLKYVLTLATSVIVGAAVLVALVERSGDASIQSFADALWWSFATVTTVGYGDSVPHTLAGRIVAVFLMVIGITVFSIVTANIASLMLRPEEEKEDAEPSLTDLMEEIRLLRQQVEALSTGTVQRIEADETPAGGRA